MAMTIPELTLGDRLMISRRKAGLDQVQMAERLGVKRTSIGQWERELARPRDLLAIVEQWSEITETPAQWLIFGDNPRLLPLGQGVLPLDWTSSGDGLLDRNEHFVHTERTAA